MVVMIRVVDNTKLIFKQCGKVKIKKMLINDENSQFHMVSIPTNECRTVSFSAYPSLYNTGMHTISRMYTIVKFATQNLDIFSKETDLFFNLGCFFLFFH